jgi:exopolyphosphatase/guanosine-5'-triphosphate,3'-diphosphate pyrophosphatase
MRTHVARVLEAEALPAQARARGARLVASGGTPTSLAALDLGLLAYDPERVHGHVLATERLVRLALAGQSPALDAGRRRILPAGAVVLEAVARAAGAREAVVSDRGIRHARVMALLADGRP